MNPSDYFFRESEEGFELCLGDCSTLDGLSCFNPQSSVQITNFGAQDYKDFGWAIADDLPELHTVADLISFFESEDEIMLVDFEVVIQDVGVLSTHDDTDCDFKVKEKSQIYAILKIAAPPEYTDLIFNKLLENPNCYLTFDESGKMTKYQTFDEYLASGNY
jgi:hypothetical protein